MATSTDRPFLYSEAERRRRDASPWTLVQGVLAPVQFAIFLLSLVLVLRTLATGEGAALANASVVAKTLALYAIMVTGSLWEKAVFGRYLFAPAFYWEDVVSMLVIGLHTAYLIALATDWIDARDQMILALAAYATYVINAAQFLLKLRAARREATVVGDPEFHGAVGPFGPVPLGRESRDGLRANSLEAAPRRDGIPVHRGLGVLLCIYCSKPPPDHLDHCRLSGTGA